MTSQQLTPASVQAPTNATRPRLVLAVACVAQLMVVLDGTVVNIALPSAQHELGFGDASRQWVVSGYALAFGSLLLLTGRLATRIGYRRAFLIGMVGFAIASALGGTSVDLTMLLVARVLQGVFAALLTPAALALITTTFTGAPERGRAFGVYGAVASAGGGIGLLLGGVLTQQISWRWCLFINIIFAAVAVVGAVVAVAVAVAVAVKEPTRARHPPPVDIPGAVLVTAGLFAVVLGLGSTQSLPWSAPSVWGPVVGGALLLTAFVLVQRRSAHPLLPLRVLTDRGRLGADLALLSASAAMFGLFLSLTYYLQETLGYGPIENGLAYLPMIAVTSVCATFLAGFLSGRVGAGRVLPAGMMLTAAGLALLTRLNLHSQYVVDVLPALLLFGLGIGLTVSLAVNLGTSGVEPADAGVASALVSTTQQVGGSIGIALLGTLAASVTGRSGGGLAEAEVAGYGAVYGSSAVMLAGASVLVALLLRSRARGAVPPPRTAPFDQGPAMTTSTGTTPPAPRTRTVPARVLLLVGAAVAAVALNTVIATAAPALGASNGL